MLGLEGVLRRRLQRVRRPSHLRLGSSSPAGASWSFDLCGNADQASGYCGAGNRDHARRHGLTRQRVEHATLQERPRRGRQLGPANPEPGWAPVRVLQGFLVHSRPVRALDRSEKGPIGAIQRPANGGRRDEDPLSASAKCRAEMRELGDKWIHATSCTPTHQAAAWGRRRAATSLN
jgi:hypothetical protein